MSTRTTQALALAIALAASGSFTEADESNRGDQLVAIANVRWQLLMGESLGVVDMYQDAAVRTGIPLSTVHEYTRNAQRAIGDGDDTQRWMEANALGATVRAYLAGRITHAELSLILDYHPA